MPHCNDSTRLVSSLNGVQCEEVKNLLLQCLMSYLLSCQIKSPDMRVVSFTPLPSDVHETFDFAVDATYPPRKRCVWMWCVLEGGEGSTCYKTHIN